MKAVPAVGLAVILSAVAGAVPAEEGQVADELPIMVEGGTVERPHRRRDKDGKKAVLSREVELPSRGVWFIWLKVTNHSQFPVVLTWDLDGKQPLRSSRSQVLVQTHTESQWLSYSRYAGKVGFKMQVNVDKPGKHTLNVRLASGEQVVIERIALTLYFSAFPTADGKSLDHADDPGRGRARFSETARQVDGFREDWKSPAIKASGKTYYVDAEDGNDAAAGTSPGRAWKSLAKVNARTFLPGDAILLKRGGTWHESLAPKGDGKSGAWITIGAYGKGDRPFLIARSGDAVSLMAQSYWVIQDLKVTTDADVNQGASGIMIRAGTGPQPKGIRILNCVSFDTAGQGIVIGGRWPKSEGYDGGVIENCLSFAHDGDGIAIHGTKQDGCRNSVVRHSTAHSCDGMAGIWIFSGQNGLIEHCVGYNNAVYNIWTWNSINVTIRRCEAFRGRPPGAFDDSGGFDIDWGCEACTIEYCYAHHNKGAGVLLMGSGKDTYLDFPKQTRYTLCRFNVFEHNGHGILVYSTFEYGKVHDNISVSHHPNKPALELWGHRKHKDWGGTFPADNEFFNNILIGVEGGHPLGVDEAALPGNNTLDYNLYWRADGKRSLIRFGGGRRDWRENRIDYWEAKKGGNRPKTVLTGLEELKEKTGWEAHGLRKKPGLKALGRGGNGRLPLKEYRLLPGSPARGAGVRVLLDEEWLAERRKYLEDTGAEEYGIPMDPENAKKDYWGEPLYPDRNSIGPER